MRNYSICMRIPPEPPRIRAMNDELYKVYLDSGKCVRILGRVLDSGMCFGFWEVFWVLGRVLDSGKCFGFRDVFLDSGTCFWILGRVLDSGTCFVPTSHRRMFMFSGKNRWRILDP